MIGLQRQLQAWVESDDDPDLQICGTQITMSLNNLEAFGMFCQLFTLVPCGYFIFLDDSTSGIATACGILILTAQLGFLFSVIVVQHCKYVSTRASAKSLGANDDSNNPELRVVEAAGVHPHEVFANAFFGARQIATVQTNERQYDEQYTKEIMTAATQRALHGENLDSDVAEYEKAKTDSFNASQSAHGAFHDSTDSRGGEMTMTDSSSEEGYTTQLFSHNDPRVPRSEPSDESSSDEGDLI